LFEAFKEIMVWQMNAMQTLQGSQRKYPGLGISHDLFCHLQRVLAHLVKRADDTDKNTSGEFENGLGTGDMGSSPSNVVIIVSNKPFQLGRLGHFLAL
jgi:hypothetical protein